MTLHEAIEKLLKQTGKSMTANEIADALNKNKWYVKDDNSKIEQNQITARVNKYEKLFNVNRSYSPQRIGLIIDNNVQTKKIVIENQSTKKSIKSPKLTIVSPSLIEKSLLDEQLFKNAGSIDSFVSHKAGLYCIRITDINKLPNTFIPVLKERDHNIIYIGIATESLRKRFLNQELRAKGHGTFFRSIGALLGYLPPKGLLIEKKNKRNYTFSKAHQIEIIQWINENLTVNWIEFDGDFEKIETDLILKYRPLLNIAKNPLALITLKELRAKCVQIANNM